MLSGFLQQGLLVRDLNLLRHNYMTRLHFKLDVMASLPTDLLYLLPPAGFERVYVRFSRLFKLTRFHEFLDRTDTLTPYPNFFRIFKLLLYVVVIIHWNACLYFQISAWLGFGTDQWVYFDISDTQSVNATLRRMYIYSLYWSTLTLTTIGETPRPVNDVEYMFVIVDFIFGVLIFATIVGDIGSVITNINTSRTAFQKRLDSVKHYMHRHRVPAELERRVMASFSYMWSHKRAMDDGTVLAQLPERLRADIAIHVHLKTLKQVSLFRDCDIGLLHELVLRLREAVFSPGDVVCQQGDVGREMYIVKSGYLNVMNYTNTEVLATLTEGSVFGEVSLLHIPGNPTGNRRTANVCSKGFSNLFTLSKNDLWQTLNEYPDAKKKLIERGKEMLRELQLFDIERERKAQTASHETIEKRLQLIEEFADTLVTRLARLTTGLSGLQSSMDGRLSVVERLHVQRRQHRDTSNRSS